MTVAAVPQEPPGGPAPYLQHVCHMSSEDLSAVIAPCFNHIPKPKPWPEVPLLSPHDAHDWLEYIMCATGDLLNDRSVDWSWDSLDVTADMKHCVASCWTDNAKKPLLLFVGNPARLGDHVWNDYKALSVLPKENGERLLTPAECIYHRISHICRKNGATFFVLTSYTTWSFGMFDHYGGACRVSAPLRPSDCPSVLLAWIYSASAYDDAIKPWDYMEHQLQQQLQAEISTQYSEFERLAYEQARENTFKLADEGERFERARRQEHARAELARSHEQRQQMIKDRLRAYYDSRWFGRIHKAHAADAAAFVEADTPSDCHDADSFDGEDGGTPRQLLSITNSPAAPSPSVDGGSVYIDAAPFTPRAAHVRLPVPGPAPVDGLSYMTPTVPNSSTHGGNSSSSPVTPSSLSNSSTSPGSDWHGPEPQQAPPPPPPPRVAHAHHAPSRSVDSVENILAPNPRPPTAMTNPMNTCGWNNEIQSKFVQHVEQMGVFPVRTGHSPAFGMSGSSGMDMHTQIDPVAAQGYAMPMDPTCQFGGYGVGWEVQPGSYPPSDYQDLQYYPTNVDNTWAPQGDYGAMGAQAPFVNNGY